MKKRLGLSSVFKLFIIGTLLIAVIGMDGCSCIKPPVIEWIKVFVDTDNDETFEDTEEIYPEGSTYTIPVNYSFQIRIKTREPLSDDDLGKSKVSIQNQPSPISIEILDVSESTYKADFFINILGPLAAGKYQADIILYSNNITSLQSITLQIK